MYRPSTVLATVLTTFAIASTASADSFCVAPATGCDHTATSLQSALSSAGSLPGDDTISLGAATYTEDNLVYSPGDHARVSITGAGSSATIIQPATASAGGVTLQATLGPMDVSGVRILAGGANGTNALWLNAGGNVDHVDVAAAGGAVAPSGINLTAPGFLGAVNIALPGSGTCVTGSGSGTFTVRESTFSDCAKAIEGYASQTHVERVRMLNVVSGLHVIGDGVSGILDDALFVGRGSGTGAMVEQSVLSSSTNTLQLDQVTLIGSGTGTGASASNTVNSSDTQLYVYDSIIRNFATPISCTSNGSDPANATADFLNYTGSPSDSCTGEVTFTNPSTVDPQFVAQGDGDYHLQASSPLVDRDPTPIRAGEWHTDLEGTVRVINGKRDLGAFERALAPTAATAPATNITATSAVLPLTANGGGANAQAKLVYGTTDAYGTQLPLEMTQADFADRRYTVALDGLTSATTYHYAIVVTNPVGTATSSDRTFTTTSAQTTPPACCTPVAKAALSALKITPSKFRAASKGATFANAVGAKVTYTLSAAGTVKFRVLRAAKGVKAGGRCVAKSRRHRTGKACTRYVAVGRSISRASAAGANSVRFSGRVSGKKLRPGRYRLQTTDPAGAAKRASFTIIRR
jgi:hypothetical protein